ncbi:Short-chain type dehydrogenase/reductase [Hibiscus syriacus]|uniref:Short-chain type dehydrogenase/reductase n=1 Tax=Hibiscus syriacus TaxID=106335 RepID=A0A6A3AQA9_HIBSY|nr:Short-chain type dehydrogenase/reductase [Hibiscus syriacus]
MATGSNPLQDRVAIVTGASSGIGRAIALHLASIGAKLVLNYSSNKLQADLVAKSVETRRRRADYIDIIISRGFAEAGKRYICGIEAAIDTMVKILAKELKGTGITANCVSPGPIATDMFFAGRTKEMVQKAIDECPLRRLGQSEDVVPLVGFLATDASEWVNGQVIRVNGGYV